MTLTPEQLLINMQRIAAKMDADMRTVSAFMKLTKAKFAEIERRLAALEARPFPPPPPPPAEATVTIERKPPPEDAIFTEGEGD